MMPGPFELIIIVGLIIYPLTIYYFAKRMDARFQLNNPDSKRFIWGYFTGITSISTPILFLIIDLLLMSDLGDELVVDVGLMTLSISLKVVVIFAGYWAIKKDKIALVMLTIISINPIIWVVNFFYLRKRWDELN